MNQSNTITALFSLIMFSASSALAAESFDIDLKELRPASVAKPAPKPQSLEIDLKELKAIKAAKPKPKHTRRKSNLKTESEPVEAGAPDSGTSSYTMRPGDHLALVLVRNYGLTEIEARRVIPEIMRLNSISSLLKIRTGQRLIIPLPLPSKPQPDKKAAENPVIPEPQQKAEPVKPPAAPANAPADSITVTYTDACALAHQVSEKLGLLVSPPALEPGEAPFTVQYEDVVVTVACELSEAEVITYQRLLSMKEESLLVFARNDSAGQVIEELAESLGLTYRVSSGDAQDTLPQTYVFSDVLPGRPEILLTITAAASKPEPEPFRKNQWQIPLTPPFPKEDLILPNSYD